MGTLVKKKLWGIRSIISVIIALSLIIGYVPQISANVDIADKYTYKIEVKVGDVKKGGTDSDIYCVVHFHNGTGLGKFQQMIDTKGHDDFERNSQRTYSFEMEAQPWQISHVELKNTGKDGMYIDWFKFYMPNGKEVYADPNCWIDKSYHIEYVADSTRRTVSAAGNIDDFGGTIYYEMDAKNQSNISKEWNQLIEDQYFNAYNAYKYEKTPSFKITASSNEGNDNTKLTESVLTSNDTYLKIKETADGYIKGYDLYTQKTLDYMKKKGIHQLNIKTNLSCDTVVDNNKYFDKTLTIIRKEFLFGDYKVTAKPYTPFKDNNFFNKNNKQITVEIPVQYKDHYSANNIAGDIAKNWKKLDIKLYYEDYEKYPNAYVNPSSVSVLSGKKNTLKMVFDMPDDVANPNGVGITLSMKNMSAYDSGKGQTYKAQDYVKTKSAYKVDTKSVGITVKDESGETVDNFDEYKNVHKIMVETDEDIYFDEEQNMFSYQLIDPANPNSGVQLVKKYSIANPDKSSTALIAPHAETTVYEIKTKDRVEGNYQLKLSGADFAGNSSEKTVNMNLDSLAPRVSYNVAETEDPIDYTKRQEIKFNITDISGTGKVHYCFVNQGESVPSTDEKMPENSGTVDSVIGKWGFVNQANPDATTAVIAAKQGEFFKGKLYYYTTDGAGNDSRNENGMQSIDIDLIARADLNCDIIVDDLTPHRPSYNVSFTTDQYNAIKYRWTNGSKTTEWKNYNNGDNPGNSNQSIGVLDGEYSLEYTVTSNLTGESATNSKKFIFDNEAPTLRAMPRSGNPGAMKTITIFAEDDSIVETIKYKLLYADGREVEGEDYIEVPAQIPAVSAEVTVAPAKSGAYKIHVIATDKNGKSTEAYSSYFSIRNSAPSVSENYLIASNVRFNTENETAYTNSQDYKVVFTANEVLECASYYDDNQILMYRASADGLNFGEWSIAGGITGEAKTYTIDTPTVLNEGENRIFIELAALDISDESEVIAENLIAKFDDTIIYDTVPPQYKIEFESTEKTTGSVFAKITLRDNYSSPECITIANRYDEMRMFMVLEDETVIEDNEITYRVEFLGNHSGKLLVYDGFMYGDGALYSANPVEIPYTVDSIDREGPMVETRDDDYDYAYTSENYNLYSGLEMYTGDTEYRVDYTMQFEVNEAIEHDTKFALIHNDDYFPQAPDPETTEGTYGELIELTPEEISELVSEEEFNEGNPNIYFADKSNMHNYINGESDTHYELLIKGAETGGYVLVAWGKDALGNESKQVVGRAFYIRDQEAALENAEAREFNAGSRAVIDLEFNVPVYVLPQNMMPNRDDYASDEEYEDYIEELIGNTVDYTKLPDMDKYKTMNDFSTTYPLIVDDYGNYTVYFMDECERLSSTVVTVTDEMVDFGREYSPQITYYRAEYDDDYNYDSDMTNWEVIEAQSIKTVSDGYAYFVAVEPADEYEQTFDAGTDSYNNGYDFSLADDYCEGVYGAYTKLVYEVSGESYSKNMVVDFLTTTNIKDIDVTRSEVIEINLKDITPPEIDYTLSTYNATKDPVTVSFTFTDNELAVDPDAGVEGGEASDEMYTDAENAANAGIAAIAVSPVYPLEDDMWIYDAEFEEVELSDTYQHTFTENGKMFVIVENTLGLSDYVEVTVDNILNDPIAEGEDFVLNYYYTDLNGDEQLIDMSAEEKPYCSSVIAKIEPTEDGIARNLYVRNNMKKFDKTLTDFESLFRFELVDQYGYTYEVIAQYDNFDSDGPEITYDAGDGKKTNEAVEATLTVSDKSEIGSVTLKHKDGTEVVLSSDSTKQDENGNYVSKFTGSLEKNGVYVIEAKDVHGNITYKNFGINNIDTVPPEVYEVVYTTEIPTVQSVGAKIYYTESNVKLTRYEIVSGVTEKDLIVDYNSSVVRFKENGSITVWFADEYGNEGSTILTVNNINRTAPTLKAVATLAEDEMSVKVKFEQQTDEDGVPLDKTRKLDELYVLYYGIARRADEAEYEFCENGTYRIQAYDTIGNIQIIDVTVEGIDKEAPKITQVSWAYAYYDENGVLQNASYSLDSIGTEAGYNIATDVYKATNQNVVVSVETDKATKFVGDGKNEYDTTHSVEYDDNGWFNFNLEKHNKRMTQYGVGVYLIDKIPPVIEGTDDLMFFENPNAGSPYTPGMLLDGVKAHDTHNGETTDLTNKITVDYGTFNPNDISANKYDRTHPYTITYTVKDSVGNETTVKRTVTLIGLFDTMVLVNGEFPDSSGRIEVNSNSVELSLYNFSGKAYARYTKGTYTSGQMKTRGTVIEQAENGSFKVDGLEEGWYTFYVQTDLRDYFCYNVYVIS